MIQGLFHQQYLQLCSRLISLCSFHVDFTLLRNGEAELVYDDGGSGTGLGGQLQSDACCQLFYFLKDVSHTHQHHNPKTDTLVDLYHTDDDVDWRIQTLYSLYRSIILFKRTRTPERITSSMGTLAYAQAFKRMCLRMPHVKVSDIPYYDDEALFVSLKAARDELQNLSSTKNRRRDLIITAMVGAFGTVFALSSLMSLSNIAGTGKPEASETLKALSHALVTHTEYAIAGVFFVVSIPFIQVERVPLLRNIVRLIQPIKKQWAVRLLLAAAVAIGVCTALFVLYA